MRRLRLVSVVLDATPLNNLNHSLKGKDATTCFQPSRWLLGWRNHCCNEEGFNDNRPETRPSITHKVLFQCLTSSLERSHGSQAPSSSPKACSEPKCTKSSASATKASSARSSR